jgi:general stress protein 26
MTIKEQKDYCLNIMKNTKACYLSTINSEGFPETRAMLNLRNTDIYPELKWIGEDCENEFIIYLTTNTSSVKTKQIRNNSKTALYFCLPESFQGVMVNGIMELVIDREIKNKLWQTGWDMYYRGGIDDPDYAILRLKPVNMKAYAKMSTFTIEFREDK